MKYPTKANIARIKYVAYGAYGFQISTSRAIDIFHLWYRDMPVIVEDWPPRSIMRRIARDECWKILPKIT
jgi:hypothetical protein